jgi:hypothetical protein
MLMEKRKLSRYAPASAYYPEEKGSASTERQSNINTMPGPYLLRLKVK